MIRTDLMAFLYQRMFAMRTAAITQPIAIHRPPKTIHNMLSKRDRANISFFRELRSICPFRRYHHAGYKRDLGNEAHVCQL
jgi:hypothetical protein